jgi:hypothetical protein
MSAEYFITSVGTSVGVGTGTVVDVGTKVGTGVGGPNERLPQLAITNPANKKSNQPIERGVSTAILLIEGSPYRY